MRGRRAFVILTLYLLLLGGFAWMVELIMERTYSTRLRRIGGVRHGGDRPGHLRRAADARDAPGRLPRPASTAGAISLEREKQTLDMLVATPISSLAIVVGKLLSALVYVLLLIAASIPLTAVVFVFGGVGPEDVLRGYLVLIVTALGLGSFGLLCSSLVQRTQAATAITIFGVLAMTIGSVFVLIFWQAMAPAQQFDRNGQIIAHRSRPTARGDRLPEPVPRPGRCAMRHGSHIWWLVLDRELPAPDAAGGTGVRGTGRRRPGADAADRPDDREGRRRGGGS